MTPAEDWDAFRERMMRRLRGMTWAWIFTVMLACGMFLHERRYGMAFTVAFNAAVTLVMLKIINRMARLRKEEERLGPEPKV